MTHIGNDGYLWRIRVASLANKLALLFGNALMACCAATLIYIAIVFPLSNPELTTTQVFLKTYVISFFGIYSFLLSVAVWFTAKSNGWFPLGKWAAKLAPMRPVEWPTLKMMMRNEFDLFPEIPQNIREKLHNDAIDAHVLLCQYCGIAGKFTQDCPYFEMEIE